VGDPGHVLNDQCGRLIGVVVTDTEDAQCPLCRQRDLVALPPMTFTCSAQYATALRTAVVVPEFTPITSHALEDKSGALTVIVIGPPVVEKPPEIGCCPEGHSAAELLPPPGGTNEGVLRATATSSMPCGPCGPRCPRRAFLARGLMSTVWIVPFLMFLDVTTMVAAVPLAAATMAETTAAMRAVFTLLNPFLSIREV
jgi:hypothetical protein